MSWANVILFLAFCYLVFRYFLFPLLLAQLTQFRVTSFSLFSTRGLEYRSKAERGNVVPTVRIERTGWVWGGLSSDEVGLVVVKLEGVSLRVKHLQRKATEDSRVRRSSVSRCTHHAY